MEKIEANLHKRVKSFRWARWFLPLVGVFVLVCAAIVYNQGKKVNRMIDRAEYGEFFWSGVDVEKEYSGWVIVAENRYATAALYLGLSIFMIALGFIAHLNYQRDRIIFEHVNKLKGEPVASGQRR